MSVGGGGSSGSSGGDGGGSQSNRELREKGYNWGEIHSGAARNEEHAKAIESGERDLSGNAMHRVGKAFNEKISGSMSWDEYQQKTADTIRRNFENRQQDSDSDNSYQSEPKPEPEEESVLDEMPTVNEDVDGPTLGGGSSSSAEAEEEIPINDEPIGGFTAHDGGNGDIVRDQPQEYADLANRIKDPGIYSQAAATQVAATQNQEAIGQQNQSSGYESSLISENPETGAAGLGDTDAERRARKQLLGG